MGLGSGVASILCEHEILTQTVRLAWPGYTLEQTWGKRNQRVGPHDLLDVKTPSDLKRIKTVIFDLTQLIYGFPKAGRMWLNSNTDLSCETFEGKNIEEVLTKCIDSGCPVGTVERMPNGGYRMVVDTFTEELLVGFLFDYLVRVQRGVIAYLSDLVAVYYVMDGERPVAKKTTAKKRALAKSYREDHKIHQAVLDFLGPDRIELLKPARVVLNGIEMFKGSLPDYFGSRDNIWNMMNQLEKMIERVGTQKSGNLNVFLAKGWHSDYESSANWFRLLGDQLESVRPLRDYFDCNKRVDMEADAMMIRLGELAVRYLDGLCLLHSLDSDVLVSLYCHALPDLVWTKSLKFKDSRNVIIRTGPKDEGPFSDIPRYRIDLQTLNPLKESVITNNFILPGTPDTFLFASSRLSNRSTWSTSEAERRLCAILVVLLDGCDFCESLKSFGPRGMVKLLSQNFRLNEIIFTRITSTENVTRQTAIGMIHECLQRFDDKIRFPWRCGDFVCLVELKFKEIKELIREAMPPRLKVIEGKDWRPFIRRLCYSAMTLSCTGIGLERDMKDNARLTENFGYETENDFKYMFADDPEYR